MLLYQRLNQPSGPTVEDYVTFLLTGSGVGSAPIPDPELSPIATPQSTTTVNWIWDALGDWMQHSSASGGQTVYSPPSEDLLGNGDWTVEARCQRFSTSTQDDFFAINQSGVRNLVRIVATDSGSRNFEARVWNGSSLVTHDFGVNSGDIHLAVSWDGSDLRGFVNGVIAFTAAGAVDFSSSSANEFGFGHASSAPNWRGEFQDVRVIKGLAFYTANFTPPARGSLPLTGPL